MENGMSKWSGIFCQEHELKHSLGVKVSLLNNLLKSISFCKKRDTFSM